MGVVGKGVLDVIKWKAILPIKHRMSITKPEEKNQNHTNVLVCFLSLSVFLGFALMLQFLELACLEFVVMLEDFCCQSQVKPPGGSWMSYSFPTLLSINYTLT